MGIELMTSSLPRMRSTPELHRLNVCLLSGKRGSNSRPSAWKADALPTELFPRCLVGGGGLEPPNPEGADLQSAAIATMRTSQKLAYQCFQSSFEPIEGFEPTTPRLQITCSGQLSYIGAHESFIAERTAKVGTFFESTKLFHRFFNMSVISSRRDSSSRPQEAHCAFCVSWPMKRSGIPIPLIIGTFLRDAKNSHTAP